MSGVWSRYDEGLGESSERLWMLISIAYSLNFIIIITFTREININGPGDLALKVQTQSPR